MIVLDKPFVSDLLKDTIAKNNFKVLGTKYAQAIGISKSNLVFDERSIVDLLNSQLNPQLYSNSENAINWISTNLGNTDLPDKINIFKDKVRFRELVKDIYPNFFFKAVKLADLSTLNIDNIAKPFIVKPSVGFFSMGVYKVFSHEEWLSIPKRINDELAQVINLYPDEVLDASTFIIEEMIEGDEFAFDAYFNSEGKPVVMGIFKHLFSSGDDVGDRVYYTSKEVIEEHLTKFTYFLEQIGERVALKNFPIHVEVRVDKNGNLLPIEVNPMRFGGWCTTADVTAHAYNLNPYEYYFKQLQPNWNELLKGKENLRYCLVILDNSTGQSLADIVAFNYEGVLSKFRKTLELRKTNWKEYPVFGMVFTETHVDNFEEIESILKSDLKEFVTLKKK